MNIKHTFTNVCDDYTAYLDMISAEDIDYAAPACDGDLLELNLLDVDYL